MPSALPKVTIRPGVGGHVVACTCGDHHKATDRITADLYAITHRASHQTVLHEDD